MLGIVEAVNLNLLGDAQADGLVDDLEDDEHHHKHVAHGGKGAECLNAQLRESDLITRVDEHSLWVILPYTMPQGLQSRIQKTMEKLAEEEGEAKRLALSVHLRSMEVKAMNDGSEAPSASNLMR